MATMTRTSTVNQGATSAAGFVGGFLPAYWDSVLGENLYPNLFMMQCGTKRTIPRNFGRAIKIPRYRKIAIVAAVASSAEGTAITPTAASAQLISGGLSQFAGAIRHSDLLLMTSLSDFVEMSIADLARDMAIKIDRKIRDTLSATGMAVGGGKDAGRSNALSGLSASIHNTADILKPRDIIRAAVRLDDYNNSRPPDQHYPAIIAPRAVYDLQTNLSGGAWLDVTKYQTIGAPRIYQGEIGRMYGVRFIASTEMKRLNSGLSAAGAVAASGYRSFMFAPNAYYVTEINGESAKTFVKQLGSAGAADPVNQYATVGAKVFFGCVPNTWLDPFGAAATDKEVRMIRLYYATTM